MKTLEQIEIIWSSLESSSYTKKTTLIKEINDQVIDSSIIFKHIIIGKEKNEVIEEFKVYRNYFTSLVRRFKWNLQIRAQVNKCYLNKKKILNQEHLDFLKEGVCRINQHPHKVSSIKSKLLSSYGDLRNVSDSTIRRSLKMKLNMSFKKLSIMNPKTFITDNFDKMIQSATLLKILPN